MIQDGYLNRNVYADDILLLMAKWDAEEYMDTPSTVHMRNFYVRKSQSHDPDTPTYIDALSVENAEEYLKGIDGEIESLVIGVTLEIF